MRLPEIKIGYKIEVDGVKYEVTNVEGLDVDITIDSLTSSPSTKEVTLGLRDHEIAFYAVGVDSGIRVKISQPGNVERFGTQVMGSWFDQWNSPYEDPDENRFLVSRWQDKPVLVIEGTVGLPAKVRFKGFKVRVTETTEKPVSIFRTTYGAGR